VNQLSTLLSSILSFMNIHFAVLVLVFNVVVVDDVVCCLFQILHACRRARGKV
jgi:hypothetical protein